MRKNIEDIHIEVGKILASIDIETKIDILNLIDDAYSLGKEVKCKVCGYSCREREACS